MVLQDKVALVTGASRGIGRTIALVMADEGANVGVVDILPEVKSTAQAIERKGRSSVAEVFDISDPVQVSDGVQRIRQRLGSVGILVNNAAIVNNIGVLTKMTHESWAREIAVNLTGAFNMIKEVIGPMIKKKWGRIINISSIGATEGLYAQIAYAASKSGLLGLTKTITIEHARDGITCNTILPGLIKTEVTSKMPEEIVRGSLSITPARRMGKMEEVAHLVSFLASEGAGFINGAEIPIDGGLRLTMLSFGSRKEIKERNAFGQGS